MKSKTVESLHMWFKTGQYPVLSWRNEEKMLALLQYLCPNSEWHETAAARLIEKTPSFTEQELSFMTWEELIEGLRPYYEQSKESCVQLGQEVYRIDRLIILSQKEQRTKDLSTLAEPIFFKFSNGAIVEGTQDWLTWLVPMPDSSRADRDHPILIGDDSPVISQLTTLCNNLQTPLPFQQLKRMGVFFSHLNNQNIKQRIEKGLKECTKIKLGDASLLPKAYWGKVSETLKNYPNALFIELDGCEISWPRGMVEAFIAHGAIELCDLSTPIDLKLADGDRGVIFQRMYKAEWMSFFTANHSQDWSGTHHPASKVLPIWALKGYLDAVVSGKFSTSNLQSAAQFCYKMATPYVKKKIDELLKPLPSALSLKPLPVSEPFRPKRQPKSWSATIKTGIIATALTFSPIAAVLLWEKYGPMRFNFKDIQSRDTLRLSAILLGPMTAYVDPDAEFISASYSRIRQSWRRATGWQRAASIGAVISTVAATAWFALRSTRNTQTL